MENPGAGFRTHVLGVDIRHNGNDLWTSPGASPAEQLQNRLSLLATLPEEDAGAQLSYRDDIFLLDAGEIVGYLAVAESLCDGEYGSLGPGRGTVDVSALPAATP